MAESGSSQYNKKVDELLSVIQLKKLRLIAKYGPQVAKYWERTD
jgi:hypothetical protein